MLPKFSSICLLLFSVVVAVPQSIAVVLNTEDGAGNTEAPENDPGFQNVGILNAGSGVYLGNGWVLTAAHVGAGSITLNGQEFDNIVDQTVQLTNSEGSGLTPSTDLLLMRLRDEPDLPALRLGCRSVSINTDVTLIGGGRDRAEDLTRWNRESIRGENNDVWTLVSEDDDFNESGYFTEDTRTVRWGVSRVTGTNFTADSGRGDVSSFQTDFFAPGSVVETSAQAVTGDSGGGVFQENGGVWELVGLIHAIGLKENQPQRAASAIFGGVTFLAELQDYADQIRSIADFEPEPGDFNGDGEVTADELDDLLFAINDGDQFDSCHYDLTGNGSVTHSDFDLLLEEAETLVGDANLDGTVGFEDFLLLARSFEEENVGWANGDFDGDNSVNFGDFLLLSRNFGDSFQPSVGGSVSAFAVPEPSSRCLASLVFVLAFAGRSRRKRSWL